MLFQACVKGCASDNLRPWLQDPVEKFPDADLGGEGKPQASWRPACVYAVRLLALGVGDRHPRSLPRWLRHASEIRATVAAVMNVPEAQQPGQWPLLVLDSE